MPTLEPILQHVPAWTLVLFRLLGIFALAPVLGSRTIPVRVRLMLGVVLAFCVYPVLLDPQNPSAGHLGPIIDHGLSIWTLVPLVAMEGLLGLAIGFGATLPLLGMEVAGRVIDQQLGLGLGGVFNPDLDEQASIVGQVYFVFAMTVFLILGGHRVMLDVLVGSFHSIPPGGFAADKQVLNLLIGLLTSMFELALRVSAPLLCIIFLETVAMGFMARTVPQINIMSIGFPLRILIGLGVLIGAVIVHTNAFTDAMADTLHQLARMAG